MEITKKQIQACKVTNWDLGNKALYDLCKNNFDHKADPQILAKVWLIGRSYAAAIERFKGKNKKNDNFYKEDVVKTFMNSEIDKKLQKLKDYDKLTEDNLQEVLETHKYLLNIINEGLTKDNKISFCSKYLHFHLPNLFFIYDSRVNTAINKTGLEREKLNEIKKELHYDKIDKSYGDTFCKCFELTQKIKNEHGIEITPRHLDNLLIEIANNS